MEKSCPFSEFLDKLQSEDAEISLKTWKSRFSKKKKNYAEVDRKIQRVVRHYDYKNNGGMLHYLKALDHNFMNIIS